MLDNYYIELSVYNDQEYDFETPPTDNDGTFVLKDTIQGFIQMRGGSYSQANQALMPNSTHLLYCNINDIIEVGNYIEFLGDYYLIEYIPPGNGISGVEDHWECGLVYQNDIIGD